ncbi:hypothetical protein SAMN04487928_13751 [Butyrivibrio proteoclasticus]|uniref:Uncharacterized protein n=1 Tax=Butyrivibrio proteoclasticus TaxID=43305 RepID=A0A1I5XV08_9FIRM|nr:hypothetical protein SAMN04487928_13751 [Butyrivibrio proteoclasticus]
MCPAITYVCLLYDKNGCDLEIRDIPIPKISEKEVLVPI